MEENSLKKKTVNGVMWSAVDRFSSQGIQFVFSILIARILMPSDYGVVAMLGIFMAISQTFIDSGFGMALIQKVNRTEKDFSTVFYFNIIVAGILYLILWFASPYIASFYNMEILEDITKVLALVLIFSSFSCVQNAKLAVAVNFKLIAKISLTTTLFTGCIGLFLAYSGYGVWALVFQMVFSSLINTVLLWCSVRWMPKLVFSLQSFKQLFSFGSKLLISSLMDSIYNNIYTLVIGKVYSPTSLGLYSRASGLAQYPSSNITHLMQNVTYPVLCSIQNDEKRLLNGYKKIVRMSTFVIFPLMIGLASVSDPLIRVVLGDKWVGSIELLQILCFSMMLYPMQAINLNMLQVKGHSDYYLKLEIIKKIQGIIILCITIPIGLVALCYGNLIFSLLSLLWNSYYSKRLIGYGIVAQIKDTLHIFIHSLIMGGIVLLSMSLIEIIWIKLIIGILIGGVYYILGAYIFHFDEFNELLSIIKRK